MDKMCLRGTISNKQAEILEVFWSRYGIDEVKIYVSDGGPY